jgi:membrane fusion protein, multidrug efflux system
MKTYLIIAATSIIFLSTNCRSKSSEIQKTDDAKDAFILTKQTVGINLSLPAELLPQEKADINAKVDGFVQSVMVDIGDLVKKGQILAKLDAPEVIAELAQANARLNEAHARFQASYDRYSRIQRAANQEGVISEAEVNLTKNQMLADSASLVSAESAVLVYGQLQDYLTIRAPFDGLITSRFVDPGDFVGNTGKSTLFTLENPRKLRLRVHVPEAHIRNIPSEDFLTFTVDASMNKNFTAKLARKSGSINRDTRTELWEYEFDNKEAELKPGMYTRVKLHLNRPADSYVVPFPAIVTSLEKKFVIRVKEGVVEWVDIREGISLANGKEIFGELFEGDSILQRGSEELKPGSNISIRIP